MEFHIWDFLNKDFQITTNLSKKMNERMGGLIKDRISEISNKLKIPPARLYEYFVYNSHEIPLDTLHKLSRILNLPLLDIEKSIITYKQKHVPEKNSIKNPNLPIKVDPYFTSLVANLFFDGSVPENGKGTYYNQKNEKIMSDFIKKVNNIFGDVNYSLRKDHRGVLSCRLPRLIGEICGEIYQVESFGTFDAEIPKILLSLNNEHKIAFILTAIIDEGSIAYDGSIIFGVSNKVLAEGVNNLCQEIGLKTGGIKTKKNSQHYYFYINSKQELSKVINIFSKKYPFISLNYKKDRLEKALQIKGINSEHTSKFFKYRVAKVTKKLKKKPCTINELSNKLTLPPRTLRRYMYKLIKKGDVRRKKVGSEYLYYLENFSNASLNSL
jgi:hypothetical protein